MNIRISEIEPTKELKPFIQSYWVGEFNIQSEIDFTQTVMPNGCIELIIHVSEDHCFLTKHTDDWRKSPAFTLLGLYPKTYQVRFSEVVKVFAIRFYPDGISNIFGVPPSEFLSTFENGTDVLGKDFSYLCSRIKEAEDPDLQSKLAECYLLRKLRDHFKAHDYTHPAMMLIRKTQGVADYQYITDHIPISLRQLQRVFKKQYGLTIRDYMRIARMNAIHKYMLSGKGNLTELAYEMEFTDQSHFIKEFRNFIGLPPGMFIKDQSGYIVNSM